MILDKLARVEFGSRDPLKPKVFFDEAIINEVSQAWQDALVMKIHGKSLGFMNLKAKLHAMWNLRASFDMMSACNDYYMVKFDLLEDKAWVMEGGPWIIQGHYLVVKQWSALLIQVILVWAILLFG